MVNNRDHGINMASEFTDLSQQHLSPTTKSINM